MPTENCQLLEQIAQDTNLTVEKVSTIITAFSARLIESIPGFQVLIPALLANESGDQLHDAMRKLIIQLENQLSKEAYEKWMLPVRSNFPPHLETGNSLF